jgi:3-deoxy-D-manno-octulosonic-acid transferase
VLAAALRCVYTVALYLALPFFVLRLWWQGRGQPGYRARIGERFGLVPVHADDAPLIWLHAVSVGEVQASLPLVKGLRDRLPGYDLMVTTTTATGAEHARRQFGDEVSHAWFPCDTPDAVARFLRRTRPAMVVLMETELWPNLLRACRLRCIPAVLVNARLSARSARRYGRLRPLVAAMLRDLAGIAAQTEADADRFRALGMPAARVRVTGSLKSDVALPDGYAAQVDGCRRDCGPARPIWIAASTHAGEEQPILAAHARVLETLPAALLVLAPRHPVRAGEVSDLIRNAGLSYRQRSAGEVCDARTQLYLLDTLGELVAFYGVADVAFVGGSLVAVGGHNLLEPAAAARPIVTGPHLFNFAEIGEHLRAVGALSVVDDAQTLAAELVALLRDPGTRARRAQSARAVVELRAGAAERLMTWLLDVLNSEVGGVSAHHSR